MLLFKDLNFRDLLQQRKTTPDGDTVWENSKLVDSALKGKLLILDNIDRLSPGALSSLQSLLIDRSVIHSYHLFNSLLKQIIL